MSNFIVPEPSGVPVLITIRGEALRAMGYLVEDTGYSFNDVAHAVFECLPDQGYNIVQRLLFRKIEASEGKAAVTKLKNRLLKLEARRAKEEADEQQDKWDAELKRQRYARARRKKT